MLAARMLPTVLLTALLGGAAWLYAPDRPRAWLEARYAAGAGEYCDVAGIRLHLRESGPRDAPALILLHGFGSSLQTWDGWAGQLSTRYRVVRFDLPGFGLTGPDPTGDYSDRRGVQVLAALMDRLGIRRASLVGNSLGGRLAWQFAAQDPDRVDRLVLISPDGFASPGFAYGRKPSLPLTMRLLPFILPRALLRMSLAPAYGDPSRLGAATVARYRDLMLAPGVRRAILARMAQVMLEDPVPLLKGIRAPTLLLWGEKDAMIPPSNAVEYARAIPHAKLVMLPGLGHVPFEEASRASLEPLLQFLAETAHAPS